MIPTRFFTLLTSVIMAALLAACGAPSPSTPEEAAKTFVEAMCKGDSATVEKMTDQSMRGFEEAFMMITKSEVKRCVELGERTSVVYEATKPYKDGVNVYTTIRFANGKVYPFNVYLRKDGGRWVRFY